MGVMLEHADKTEFGFTPVPDKPKGGLPSLLIFP
jgi:hypothetical protein